MRLVATATYTAINLSDKNPLNSHDKVASLTPATVTHAHTHTHPFNGPVGNYPGEPVPER